MTPKQALDFIAQLIDQNLPLTGPGRRNVNQALMAIQACVCKKEPSPATPVPDPPPARPKGYNKRQPKK